MAFQSIDTPQVASMSFSQNDTSVSMNSCLIQFEDARLSNVANFVLFANQKLSVDFLPQSFKLFFRHGEMTDVKISTLGQARLASTEIEILKSMNKYYFDILLQRRNNFQSWLFDGLPSQIENEIQPNEPIYLLVPVSPNSQFSKGCFSKEHSVSKALGREESVSQLLQFLHSSQMENTELKAEGNKNVESIGKSLDSFFAAISSLIPKPAPFALGNKVIPENELVGTIVLVKHSSTVYRVSAIEDFTAKDPFPDDKFTNFVEYYQRKYGIELKHPDQRMLHLRRLSKPLNLLEFRSESPLNPPSAPSRGEILPAELCHVSQDCQLVRAPVWHALMRAPSVARRLEGLLLASELKQRVGDSASSIKTEKVLEALTGNGCAEGFSYERYEIIGDSYLKYAVARHWFLELRTATEGDLTNKLMESVSNRHLSSLSLAAGLPGYIAITPFDPATWQLPGLPLGAATSALASVRQARSSSLIQAKKTLADVAEALIGVLDLESSTEEAALSFLSFLGMEEGGPGGSEGRFQVLANKVASLVDSGKGNSKISQAVISADQRNELQGHFKYRFRNTWLLDKALVHPSACQLSGDWASFERLEFLGDAVLGYLVTRHLAESHPHLDPGQINALKQLSVCNERFARSCLSAGLHRHLSIGSAPLALRISKFEAAVQRQILQQRVDDRDGLKPRDEGGNWGELWAGLSGFGDISESAPKALSDAFEALAGAVLLDSGLDVWKVWEVAKPFLEPFPDPETVLMHPICQLGEMCAKEGWKLEMKMHELPEQFRSEVWVNDNLIAVETNENLQTARRLVSASALKNLSPSGEPIRNFDDLNSNHGDIAPLKSSSTVDDIYQRNMLPEKEIRYMHGKHGKSLYWRKKNPPEGFPESSSAFSHIPVSIPSPVLQSSKLSEPDDSVRAALEEINSKINSLCVASKGSARASLNELCTKFGYNLPQYTLVGKSGVAHSPLFTFRGEIVLDKIGVIVSAGEPMPSHAKAKDEAALELLEMMKARLEAFACQAE